MDFAMGKFSFSHPFPFPLPSIPYRLTFHPLSALFSSPRLLPPASLNSTLSFPFVPPLVLLTHGIKQNCSFLQWKGKIQCCTNSQCSVLKVVLNFFYHDGWSWNLKVETQNLLSHATGLNPQTPHLHRPVPLNIVMEILCKTQVAYRLVLPSVE